VALMFADEVVGAVLCDQHGILAEVHWRVVAPAYRISWANLILTSAAWDRLLEAGVTHIKFSTTNETPDTERMVQTYGVEQSYRVDHYLRRLA
jgi:hypothetical protein